MMINHKLRLMLIGMLLVLALAGCSKKSDGGFNSGAGTKGKDWQMTVPDDAFEDKSKVKMSVVTQTDSFAMGETTLISQPVKLEVDNQANVRLGAPVVLTVAIPKDYMDPAQAASLFFGYYANDAWEYFLPTTIDYKAKTATYEAYHFSTYALVKPSDQEKIKAYTTLMATEKWQNSEKAKALKQSIDKNLQAMLSELGVRDNTVRNQLIADVVSYLENETMDSGGVSPMDALAQMANSASKGAAGKQEFSNKLLEFTGKALASTLETVQNAPGAYTEKFGQGLNVIGNLSSALGYMTEGDTKGAAEAIANMLKNTSPAVALVDSSLGFIKNSIENSIENWTKEELEKAYQIYATGKGGKYGYEDGLKGDFEAIFTLLGGGDRQSNLRIIANHCKRLNISESDLSQEERLSIIANAKRALKSNFERRMVSEAEINRIKSDEAAFIDALMNEGLLSASDYKKYFREDRSFNVLNRLEKLYHTRELVLAHIDEDVASALSHQDMARIIKQWIFWAEKNQRSGFLKYLKDMGYIREPLSLKGAEPKFAWRLIKVVQSDWQTRLDSQNASSKGTLEFGMSVGANSVVFKRTYTGKDGGPYGDGWQKTGMTEFGEVTWSDPNQSVFLPEDEIALSVSVKHVSSEWKYPSANWMVSGQVFNSDKEGKQQGSAGYLYDKDGVSTFTSGGGNGFASYDGVLKGKMGSGSSEGDYKTIRANASCG